MNFRRFLLWAALIAVVAVGLFSLDKIDQFLTLLGQARWQFLLLIPLIQLGSYWSNAKYYQSFLGIMGFHQPFKRLFETSIVINFVNQVFPSAGVSGASFLSRSLEGVPVGRSTLAQIFRYIFTFLSFVVVLMVGFLLLYLGGGIQQATVRWTGLFILLIIASCIVLITLVSNRKAVEAVGDRAVSGINRIAGIFKRHPKHLIDRVSTQRFYKEFYEGVDILHGQRGRWLKPMAFALVGNLAEVTTVYVAFLALGEAINPGVVIAGYALANFFSLLSLVTTGIGVYEGAMIATFVALGVPFALSLSVTVLYRVMNMLIFLPLGFYYYRRSL